MEQCTDLKFHTNDSVKNDQDNNSLLSVTDTQFKYNLNSDDW